MLVVSLDMRTVVMEKRNNDCAVCFVTLCCPAPEFPILEKQNWLIHLHYIRKDYEACKVRDGNDRENERLTLLRKLTQCHT